MLAGLAAAALLRPSSAVSAAAAARLRLRNLHTAEVYDGRPFDGGPPGSDERARIARLMRDHRTGAIHPIDPRLIRLLLDLAARLAPRSAGDVAYLVLSGYRSPETNALLARTSRREARNSLHMRGMAVDVRVAGLAARRIAQAALELGAGGVGFYPDGRFVHLDCGPPRHWSAPVVADLPEPLVASLESGAAIGGVPAPVGDLPSSLAASALSVGGLAIVPDGAAPTLGGLSLGGGFADPFRP